jgi:hypothetical protein
MIGGWGGGGTDGRGRNHKKTKKCCRVKKNVYICIVKYIAKKGVFLMHVFDNEKVEYNLKKI